MLELVSFGLAEGIARSPQRAAARTSLLITLRSAVLSLAAIAAASAGCSASGSPPQQRREQRAPDRSLAALDRLLQRNAAPQTIEGFEACRASLDLQGICVTRPADGLVGIAEEPRTFRIRIALDPLYPRTWPDWQARLAATLACVNRLYQPTGIRWEVASITPWDPGQARTQLYALLHRLQRDFPADRQSVTLGIAVWGEQQVFRKAGGEIGLSQGSACVVASWPRVENDCVILAHELGHLVGARHVPGKEWIMGWAARPFFLPAADPLARVIAVYRFHPFNVELIRAHRSARFTDWGLRPTGDCLRRVALLRRCWRPR